jgi:hypothetical protein
MIRSGLMCLLLGTLAWGQAAKSSQSMPAQASDVAPDAPVITINGLCDDNPTGKSMASACKVIFTRAQFEAFANLLQPNESPEERRQLAATYADTLILAEQALEMGLEKNPRFEELLKLQRLGLLRQLLTETFQQQAAQISDKDIADYYQQNISTYEEAQLQRLYVPLFQQMDPSKEKLTDAQTQQRQQGSEAAMKKEADELHARAIAGEDLAKLQDEAYKVAEIKTYFAPSKMQTYRRSDLTSAQVSVMNLKPGEISPVIKDGNGYYIFKIGEKDTVPLEKVRSQIISTLRSQRLQQYLKTAHESTTTVLNEQYFTVRPPAGIHGISAPNGSAPRKVPGAAE